MGNSASWEIGCALLTGTGAMREHGALTHTKQGQGSLLRQPNESPSTWTAAVRILLVWVVDTECIPFLLLTTLLGAGDSRGTFT